MTTNDNKQEHARMAKKAPFKIQFLSERIVRDEGGDVVDHFRPGEVVDFGDQPDSADRWLRRNCCVKVDDDVEVGVHKLTEDQVGGEGDPEFVPVASPQTDADGNVLSEEELAALKEADELAQKEADPLVVTGDGADAQKPDGESQ